MPYIKMEERDRLDRTSLEELGKHIKTVGELTYCLYKLLLDYRKWEHPSYALLSESMAAAECAKLEFYHRWLRNYEEMKIEENGDIL
jgi:hypothetical protein